jgi:hypothetical protein
MTSDRKTLNQSETALNTVDDQTLGRLLKEYVGENNHAGWDGYSKRDLTSVRKFLDDLTLFIAQEHTT